MNGLRPLERAAATARPRPPRPRPWRAAMALALRTLLAAGFLAGACLAAEDAPATAPGTATGGEYDGVRLPQREAVTAAGEAILQLDPALVAAPGDGILLGLNHRWVKGERLYRRELAQVLQGVRLPLNRMAGSNSQLVRWKGMIGPVAKRKPGLTRMGHRIQPEIGLVEWIRSCREVDPQAGFTWAFNCILEEPEDHADLVEFLTGDAARGGWAARRAGLGLPEPVAVRIWELGNEVDWVEEGRARFPTAAAYADYAARCVAAIRRVKPDACIAACGATAPWAWQERKLGDWREWNRTVLATLGKGIDLLTWHPYYDGYAVGWIERNYMDLIREDLLAAGGGVRLYISEHGPFPSKYRTDKRTWSETHSLQGCLSTASFIARMAQRPEVGDLVLHAFSGEAWGMVFPGGEDGVWQPLWTTGLVPLFTVLQAWEGGPVLRTELQDPAADGAKRPPLVVAVRGGAGSALRVLAVNHSISGQRSLRLTGSGPWRVSGGLRFTGPGLEAVNGPTCTPLVCQPVAAEPEPRPALVLPPLSVSVLTLEGR